MNTQKLAVKFVGLRPLVMHNWAMMDPDNEFVMEKGKLQRAMKKLKKDDVEGREQMRRRIERVECCGGIITEQTCRRCAVKRMAIEA